MTNPDEVKDKFYDDLDSVISATPRIDTHLPRGLQCQRTTDHQTCEGVFGTEGVGKCNSNGLLLLKKCTQHELMITDTVPTRNKTSWMHPRSKHCHLIDYVIVRRTDRQNIRKTPKDCVWYRLLDRLQACCQQTHPAHSASTATTRQERAKEIGCLLAEAGQHEASIHH